MGKRGPRPTPSAMMSPDSRPMYDRAHEPKPTGTLNLPPEYLSEGAKEVWGKLVPKLLAMGVGTDVDEDAFARYCQSYAMWMGLAELIEKEGVSETIHTQHGQKTQRTGNFLAYMELTRQIERMEVKFGLTPSDRVGLGKSQGKNDGQHGNSKRAALLNRNK